MLKIDDTETNMNMSSGKNPEMNIFFSSGIQPNDDERISRTLKLSNVNGGGITVCHQLQQDYYRYVSTQIAHHLPKHYKSTYTNCRNRVTTMLVNNKRKNMQALC